MCSDIVYNTKECELNPGFYVLADYPRYAINTEGVVINRKTGDILKPTIKKYDPKFCRKNGYAWFGLTKGELADSYLTYNGTGGCFRHRALCMTFKPLPENYKTLPVNHKNGVPGDDWLDNLEWSTHSKNNHHARKMGLYPNSTYAVHVRFPDGNVVRYHSVGEAVRKTSKPEHFWLKRLRESDGKVYNDGWGIKRESSEWDNSETPKAFIPPRPVIALDLNTGKELGFTSPDDVWKRLRLAPKAVKAAIECKSICIPYSLGYLWKYADDERPWPKLDDRILPVLRNRQSPPSVAFPHILTDINTGEEVILANKSKVAEHLGVSMSIPCRYTDADGPYKNWMITKKPISEFVL